MYQIAMIPFEKTQGFISIKDEQTGEIYVSPRSICENFGIAWPGQQQKLSVNASRWGYKTVLLVLPGDDREREVAIIPDRKVRTWICGINTEKVNPEIKAQLEAFQDECDAVLYDYWTKGLAVNPRHEVLYSGDDLNRMADQLVKNANELTVHANELAAQAGLIKALVNESNMSRDRMDKLERRVDSNESRIAALEMRRLLEPPESTEYINSEQIEILKAKIKASGQKPISVWKKFNKHFDVNRYIFLPANKFSEALEWITRGGSDHECGY